MALCPAFKIFCSWATVHWGIFGLFLRQSSWKDTELMAWTWDQQDSFGLWVAERMSLNSRQHLPSWCGESHWADVAGNPSSCLVASPAAPISHSRASWAVYTTSVHAVALSPWRWATVLPILRERHGFCNLLSTWVLLTFPFLQLLSTSAGVLSLAQSNVVFYKVVHPLWPEIWQKIFLVFFFNLMKHFSSLWRTSLKNISQDAIVLKIQQIMSLCQAETIKSSIM